MLGTDQVIYGVPSQDLISLENFKVDILICMEGWVGMIKTIKSKVRTEKKNKLQI